MCEFLASEYAVTVLPSEFVVVRKGAGCCTVAVEFKCERRADAGFVAGEQPSALLPCVGLVDLAVADFQNFVAALLISGDFGPVGIHYQNKRRFEVNINTRFVTPSVIADVRKNGVGEAITIEVCDHRIIDVDVRIGVGNRDSRVIKLTDVELAE